MGRTHPKSAGAARLSGKRRVPPWIWPILLAVLVLTLLICIAAGSVVIPLPVTVQSIWQALRQQALTDPTLGPIIVAVRVPRVLTVALVGAALSVSGAAMQGLLRNPLADGSTIGISSGASLGAVLSIAFGLTLPGVPFVGTMTFAMIFAFGSVLLILFLAYRLDHNLATTTIILIGIVFSMFASSLISLTLTFAGHKASQITFWTMGSLSGSTYGNAALMLLAVIVAGGLLLSLSRELNAFAIGEENARSIGVPVRRVKLLVLLAVCTLIGLSVSIGGNIGFVGLVMPHISRQLVGPNHLRLLPASMIFGAIFLLLADLLARTMFSPLDLPIGVITSFFGSIVFVFIFSSTRRKS